MGKKNARSGGKFGGTHTTLSEAATIISDIAHTCSAITKISPGFLKAGLPSVQGKRRIKITDQGSRLLLTIRDNTTNQEVHIYTTDTERAIKAILAGATEAGFITTYQKH